MEAELKRDPEMTIAKVILNYIKTGIEHQILEKLRGLTIDIVVQADFEFD